MFSFRKKTIPYLPLTLSAILISLNIVLMVCWIILLAQHSRWTALTMGTVAFAFVLLGLSFYVFLIIKERRLDNRQSTFLDSVTHELKSPVASLGLYLETLQIRELDETQRSEFYGTMAKELHRLDVLITHLLEVARLDSVGHDSDVEDVSLGPLLRGCAKATSNHYGHAVEEIFSFELQPVVVTASRLVLEMILGNLLDNSVKYGGKPPFVHVESLLNDSGKALVRISDNGKGIPHEIRKSIFGLFFRGGDELQRKQKGTGLGLYIAQFLVKKLKGTLSVRSSDTLPGSTFEVLLPGRSEACES